MKANETWVSAKGVGRNFSRGGLSGAPGEGSPAIFQIPGGGAQPRIFVASMVKMKEFSGQGGHAPPPLAFACLRPWCPQPFFQREKQNHL